MINCHTKKLKLAKAFKATAALSVGTIHFASITFHTPKGALSQPIADVGVARLYVYDAAGVINSYCSAYGVAPFKVDMETIYTFDVNLMGITYRDQDLQGWVNQMAAAAKWGPTDAVVILNPKNIVNVDAPISQGVLGYHGAANVCYSFVNSRGEGFTVPDGQSLYAYGLSHEIEEMTVDPMADLSKPEVSDACSGNCGIFFPNYFDDKWNWIGAPPGGPPTWLFYISGVAKPANVGQCPPLQDACTYAPPTVITPPPPPGPVSFASKTASGSVSAQAAAVEAVTIEVTQPDGTKVSFVVVTDATGSFTATFTPTQAGAHSAVASVAADAQFDAASSTPFAFTVSPTLSPRTISLSVA